MKSILIITAAMCLVSCSQTQEAKVVDVDPSREELVQRGKYLATIGVCNDCHTPKSKSGLSLDSSRLLSGHPQNEVIAPIPAQQDWVLFSNGLTSFVGPWGVSYAANLTPHETGTGNWSFEQFKTALRHGKYKGMEGSRDLLPPMPWEMYRHMTDADMLALFTFLQSIKPVDNLVPAPIAPSDMALAGEHGSHNAITKK
jgi:hypothetical protein